MDVRIELGGAQAVYRLDGREIGAAPLGRFLDTLVGRADYLALPDAIPEGVRFIRRRGQAVALAVEERPQIRTVRWLAEDSPVRVGPGTRYRTRSLAFPFIVLVVVFNAGALTGHQQCFYRTSPLRSLADALLVPNLLNVAGVPGQPCWLCLKGLKKSLAGLPWEDKVREIRSHFFGAGFNGSAEGRGRVNLFEAMREIDPRIATLDAWEDASRRDPFFPLGVPWRAHPCRVGEVIAEMLEAVAGPWPPASAAPLAAFVGMSRIEPEGRQRGAPPGAPEAQ